MEITVCEERKIVEVWLRSGEECKAKHCHEDTEDDQQQYRPQPVDEYQQHQRHQDLQGVTNVRLLSLFGVHCETLPFYPAGYR